MGKTEDGTVYTRDVVNNQPYYMITYDGEDRISYIARNTGIEFLNEKYASLLAEVKKIEKYYNNSEIMAIRYHIDEKGKISLYDAEPFSVGKRKRRTMTDKDFFDTKSLAKCTYLDKFNILSDRAFWNPAEIIGVSPRPLEYSMYDEMLMSGIWSKSISKLGYQYVDASLMQKIGNKPYISMENTFDGLTPANLPQQLRYRLNRYYEQQLKEHRERHDKAVFEIIFNAYDFCTDDRLKELSKEDFSDDEIRVLKKSLFKITDGMVRNHKKSLAEDMDSLDRMAAVRDMIEQYEPMEETNVMKLYKYISELFDAIKEYNSPQFSRQGRFDFVALNFCRTLVKKGYIPSEDILAFIESEVPGRNIIKQVRDDEDKKSVYDIRNDQVSFKKDEKSSRPEQKEGKNKSAGLDEKALKTALNDAGFEFTTEEFIEYITSAMNNREYFKEEFIKSLGMLLDIIRRLGDLHGIAREDMSYLEIQELLSYHSRDAYIDIIEERRNMYHAYTHLLLPEVIFGIGDIDVIEMGAKPAQ
jgi:hypothetical protein